MKTQTTPASAPGRESGFTLLEALIAMAILSIGVLAACMMQGSALRASNLAYNRTEANNVAMTLVSAMQQLPFDDAMLEHTGSDQNNSKYEIGGTTDTREVSLIGELPSDCSSVAQKDLCDRVCRSFDRNDNSALADLVRQVFTMKEDGKVTDNSGITFKLRWAVQDVKLKEVDAPTDKIIRIFMEWDTLAGIPNHLVFTTNKFRNDKFRNE